MSDILKDIRGVALERLSKITKNIFILIRTQFIQKSYETPTF